MEHHQLVPTAFGEMRPGHPHGHEVMTLQSFLVRMQVDGFGIDLIDGRYGSATRTAVGRLQQVTLGLTPTGVLDPLTRLGIAELMQREALKGRPSGFHAAVTLLFEDGSGAPSALLRDAQTESATGLHALPEACDAAELFRLSQLLAGRGYYADPPAPDGRLNARTLAALRAYQMELGLHPIGLVNGQADCVTASFLQIDADERQRPTNASPSGWNSPQMQYARLGDDPLTAAALAAEAEQSSLVLLRVLLDEITGPGMDMNSSDGVLVPDGGKLNF